MLSLNFIVQTDPFYILGIPKFHYKLRVVLLEDLFFIPSISTSVRFGGEEIMST